MNKQLEALTKHVHGLTMGKQTQQVAVIRCDFCGEGHANGLHGKLSKGKPLL